MTDSDKPSPWGRRPDDRKADKRQLDSRSKRESDSSSNNAGRHPYDIGRRSRFPTFVVAVIVFLFILVIAAWFLSDRFPGSGALGGLVYDGLLLAFVGAGLWAHVRSSPGRALRHLASWVIIFGVMALGYNIWTGLDAAKGLSGKDSISFRADIRGHYFVRADVNGVSVLFLVDTGASDVALTREDARRIGLPVDRLSYNMPYNTANGVAYGARVRLATIAIGPITEKNISGSVVKEGLDYSLLGMSFLKTLSGYKVVNGVLTLYP